MKTYIVNVGNIGNIEIIGYTNAVNVFNEYCNQSKSNIGNASGEDVCLFSTNNDSPIKEYFAPRIENETNE